MGSNLVNLFNCTLVNNSPTGTIVYAGTQVALKTKSQTIESTIATGTAPLVVASTTNVANLNASSLNGATFAAPGAIGGGTSAAGSFTIINATGSNATISVCRRDTNITAYSLYSAAGELNFYNGSTNDVTIVPSVSLTVNNALITTTTVKTGGYTVATLPIAGTAGRRAYVTDALLPLYNTILTGGGAVVVPVFDNGVAWVSA
jgi:hypothetical protein